MIFAARSQADVEDSRQAIAEARAARAAAQPESVSQPAAEPAPLQVQAQQAATQAAELSAASTQLAENWTGMVSPPPVKEEPHEVKPSEAVPGDAYQGVSEADRATLSGGAYASAQEQYQTYMQGAVKTTIVSGEVDSTYTEALTGDELAAYQANFRADNGLNSSELARLQGEQAAVQQRQAQIDEANAIAEEKRRQIAAGQTFAETTYGLSVSDQQLLANPEAAAAQVRYQTLASDFENGLYQFQNTGNSEGGSGISDPAAYQKFVDQFVVQTVQSGGFDTESVINTLRYNSLEALKASYVDPSTGLTGAQLAHLTQAQQEQIAGDAASQKLKRVNVGSFTGNTAVAEVPADEAFKVIGKDQMDALLAKGASNLGKAFVLNETGQLILPDEMETGVYFLSNATANQLRAGGVIDERNGGLNIDGLYLDSGSAHIGTSRPSGGLFGGILNGLSHILPGGAIGGAIADAISDTTEFINRPILDTAKALGDEHGIVAQAADLTNVTVDVSAHARETGNETFMELARRSTEDAEALGVINSVGQAMISTGILAGVGAILTVTSASVLAGQAQLRGEDADPDAGIMQAGTALALSAVMGGGENLGLSSASTGAQAGGLSQAIGGLQMGETATAFATSATSSAVSQAMATGDVNLRDALVAGALAGAGVNTQIGTSGINFVQVAQVAQGLYNGNDGQVASTLVSMANGVRTQSQAQARNQAVEDYLRSQGGRTDSIWSDVPSTPAPQETSVNGPADPTRNPEAPPSSAPEPSSGRQDLRRSDNSIDASRRTVLDSGVALQGTEGSNRITIQTSTSDRAGFDQAFAAARAAGLGVFEWEGGLYNTATRDQVETTARQIVAGTPGLAEADVSRVGEAVSRAISQDAMNVANHPDRANLPGMDRSSLGAEVADILRQANVSSSALTYQNRLDQAASASGTAPSLTPDTGLFDEAAESRGSLPVNSNGVASFAPNSGPIASSPDLLDAARDRVVQFLESRTAPGTVLSPLEALGAAFQATGETINTVDRNLHRIPGAIANTIVSGIQAGQAGVVDLLESRTAPGQTMGPWESFGAVLQAGLDRINQSSGRFINSVRTHTDSAGEEALVYLGAGMTLAGHLAYDATIGAAGRIINTMTNPNASDLDLTLAGADGFGLATMVAPLGRALGSLTRAGEDELAAVAAQRAARGAEPPVRVEAPPVEPAPAPRAAEPAPRPAEPAPATAEPAPRSVEPEPEFSFDLPEPGPPWRQIGPARVREIVDEAGVRWQEVQEGGRFSRTRLMDDVGGLRGAPALDGAAGPTKIPLSQPEGATQVVRIHGAAAAPERAFLESALDYLPPAMRRPLNDVYLAGELGGELDAAGTLIPGSRVAGLAGSDGRIALDRALALDPEAMIRQFGDARGAFFHEIAHLSEGAIKTEANAGLWGRGNFVSEAARLNVSEDIAETGRAVMQNWRHYFYEMSAADWAKIPAWEKMMEVVRAFGGKVYTAAEVTQAK